MPRLSIDELAMHSQVRDDPIMDSTPLAQTASAPRDEHDPPRRPAYRQIGNGRARRYVRAGSASKTAATAKIDL